MSHVKWKDCHGYFDIYGLEVCKTVGDGFCFITSIGQCLEELMEFIDQPHMSDFILAELLTDEEYYSQFTTTPQDGIPKSVFEQATSHFHDGVYTSDIVDVIIVATPNALNVKLNIFDERKQYKLKTALTSNNEQDKNQQIQEEIAESPENTILYKTTLAPTHLKITETKEINILYFANPSGIHGFGCHYNSLIPKKNKKQNKECPNEFETFLEGNDSDYPTHDPNISMLVKQNGEVLEKEEKITKKKKYKKKKRKKNDKEEQKEKEEEQQQEEDDDYEAEHEQQTSQVYPSENMSEEQRVK